MKPNKKNGNSRTANFDGLIPAKLQPKSLLPLIKLCYITQDNKAYHALSCNQLKNNNYI
jgi:hypothetical protein